MESGIQLKESGIPLTIGIQNPSFADKDWTVVDALFNTWAKNKGCLKKQKFGFTNCIMWKISFTSVKSLKNFNLECYNPSSEWNRPGIAW